MYQDYPKRIRSKRMEKGLSQQEVADRANMCLRTYRAIERGEVNPKINQLADISAQLDTTVADLVR